MIKFGLKETNIQKICDVFSRYPPVEQAILYGSRAKGNYKNGSDIDLTLHGGDDLTLRVLYRIMEDIDDLLLPYTIDLSLFDQIDDPDVVAHIERVGVIFYKKRVSVYLNQLEDYELGQFVRERQSEKEDAIAVDIDEL